MNQGILSYPVAALQVNAVIRGWVNFDASRTLQGSVAATNTLRQINGAHNVTEVERTQSGVWTVRCGFETGSVLGIVGSAKPQSLYISAVYLRPTDTGRRDEKIVSAQEMPLAGGAWTELDTSTEVFVAFIGMV